MLQIETQFAIFQQGGICRYQALGTYIQGRKHQKVILHKGKVSFHLNQSEREDGNIF